VGAGGIAVGCLTWATIALVHLGRHRSHAKAKPISTIPRIRSRQSSRCGSGLSAISLSYLEWTSLTQSSSDAAGCGVDGHQDVSPARL